jgi:MEDS: MEthanogen/methylotroph, DcmR Sensory domain
LTLQVESIEIGNHSIAIYSDTEQKIQETLDYLRKGLERNETIIFITADLTKEEVEARMEKGWGVDVHKLEAQGDIVIKSAEEWYFKEGTPNWRRTASMFLALEEEAVKRGKSGLRGAGDTRVFFEKGYVAELIDYESSLERKFDISFTPMCTYSREDFDTLTPDQVSRLKECHYHFALHGGMQSSEPR